MTCEWLRVCGNRDDARNVLVAMMAELGAKYLYYAIQVLHNACPAKGYTAHVLGYTLHSILDVLAKVQCCHSPHLHKLRCPAFFLTPVQGVSDTCIM